jgi:hypothetical protein
LGLLEHERLREQLMLRGDRERSREQDRGQRLRARRDDGDREPPPAAELLELAATADEYREQKQGDQRVFGDHDLGRAEVLNQLVAEVGVRGPQRGGDRHEHNRVTVDQLVH